MDVGFWRVDLGTLRLLRLTDIRLFFNSTFKTRLPFYALKKMACWVFLSSSQNISKLNNQLITYSSVTNLITNQFSIPKSRPFLFLHCSSLFTKPDGIFSWPAVSSQIQFPSTLIIISRHSSFGKCETRVTQTHKAKAMPSHNKEAWFWVIYGLNLSLKMFSLSFPDENISKFLSF